jgi:N-acetylglucosaminyldiphosphoundecaprenol N-acetyl-beta-D-mannosaminyltransferase
MHLEQPRPNDADMNAIAWIWGLPISPLTSAGLLEAVDGLVRRRQASYVITANLNYAMLSYKHDDLRKINGHAAHIVADGMPLVWASRSTASPLPERVAGSDFLFALTSLSAEKGHRLFFLGGAPGVAEAAAANLRAFRADVNIVGIESPPFRALDDAENAALIQRIRSAGPDILLVAFGQPKGERWIHANYRDLDVPVCMQVGASLDFAAGRVRRAPRWMQRTGLEWAYRLALEPRRLGRRYFDNILFLMRCLSSRNFPPADVNNGPGRLAPGE